MSRKNKCKYCDSPANSGADICWNCLEKLRLIRKMQRMINSVKRSKRNEK